MSNIIHKLILNKCPNYDFNQYHFKFGDVVDTLNGARIFVIEGSLDYVEAFILKSSFSLRRYTQCLVSYKNLPRYSQGEFTSIELPVTKSLRWKVGDVVIDPQFNNKLLLIKEGDRNSFTAVILESANPQHVGYRVCVINPYRDYLLN